MLTVESLPFVLKYVVHIYISQIGAKRGETFKYLGNFMKEIEMTFISLFRIF